MGVQYSKSHRVFNKRKNGARSSRDPRDQPSSLEYNTIPHKLECTKLPSFEYVSARRQLARSRKWARQAREARRLLGAVGSSLVVEQMDAPGTEKVHEGNRWLNKDNALPYLKEGAQE